MKMYITMCGNTKKLSTKGVEYGWSSTMFCMIEQFWDEGVFSKACKITPDEAVEKIIERIHTLNPNADSKKIKKFIGACLAQGGWCGLN